MARSTLVSHLTKASLLIGLLGFGVWVNLTTTKPNENISNATITKNTPLNNEDDKINSNYFPDEKIEEEEYNEPTVIKPSKPEQTPPYEADQTKDEEIPDENTPETITEIASNQEEQTDPPSEEMLSDEPTEQNDAEYFSVIKVVDGDTIDVQINGKTERLRLIGMDTPETVDPRKTVQCFGTEASNKAKELLLNKKVRLESDETQTDRDKYGRLLRYTYLEDGTFFNAWMIENGYAHEYTYTIPYKYQTEFKTAEEAARTGELGLWNPLVCATNTAIKNKTPTSSNGAGHTFYTSKNFTAKLYYCDTDTLWQSLSKKYLLTYTTEAELKSAYPNKTLHEPCK